MAVLDLLEALGYMTAFWLFLFSSKFRRRQIEEFVAAGFGGRCMRLIEGFFATTCGMLPLAGVAWLIG